MIGILFWVVVILGGSTAIMLWVADVEEVILGGVAALTVGLALLLAITWTMQEEQKASEACTAAGGRQIEERSGKVTYRDCITIENDKIVIIDP